MANFYTIYLRNSSLTAVIVREYIILTKTCNIRPLNNIKVCNKMISSGHIHAQCTQCHPQQHSHYICGIEGEQMNQSQSYTKYPLIMFPPTQLTSQISLAHFHIIIS